MEHYAGIDVSLELSSVCVVDATGRIVREAKVPSEPEALVGFLGQLGLPLTRVGPAFLIILDPAVGEPVPRCLLELGLGDERHGSKAQLAHEPVQQQGALLEARGAVRWPPARCRSCHRCLLPLAAPPACTRDLRSRFRAEPPPAGTVPAGSTQREQRRETANPVSLGLLYRC